MRAVEFDFRAGKKRWNFRIGTEEEGMDFDKGKTRTDGFFGNRFKNNVKNENAGRSLSGESDNGNLRKNGDPKRLATTSKTGASTVAFSATKKDHSGPSASSSQEVESSSISALELAKLLRGRTPSSPVSILDCRPPNLFNQGHCVDAEHISPPPTLFFNRRKGKPEFWPDLRQKLSIPDHNQNGRSSTVILIDDDSNDEGNYSGNNKTNARSSADQQREQHPAFSSFLLNNLRSEGCMTHFLEKGAMNHFLAEYPDLCVFEHGNASVDGDWLKGTELAPDHSGDTMQRPCSLRLLSALSPSSLFSKRQSSTRSTTGAPFLPPLKLENLSLKQDSPSSITDDSTASKAAFSGASVTSARPTSSSTTITEFDYDKCSTNSSLLLSPDRNDGASKSANDREPANIYKTLYLGNADHAQDLETLRRYNIKYILNVTPDLPNRFENAYRSESDDSFKYLRIPIVDNVSQNLSAYFPVANEFIDEAIQRKCGVLVHCLAGISRSVTFTVAYLMKSKGCTMDEAYDLVKKRKPNIEPNLNFMRQLLDYEHSLLRSAAGGDVTPDSAVSSLSTSSSSSVGIDPMTGGR